MRRIRRKSINWFLTGVLALILSSRYVIPVPTFDVPTATVLETQRGELLGARIADDGQWRFPAGDSIPPQFVACLLQFEDQYFYHHPGINPVSLYRSFKTNLAQGRIVSGGSTLTMQVARLLRNGKPRTYSQKLLETLIAIHLEINFTKDEILAMYVAHAPFGGNVVGLEAASWRYFGRPSHQLSWAEYAVLAVLPNAPSLLYPGKNTQQLKQKRDRLLDRLLEKQVIDEQTCKLAKLEPLPDRPVPLPQEARHALDRMQVRHPGQRATTSLRYYLQRQAQQTLNTHVAQLASNQVFNAAALIVQVDNGNTLAYVGNATGSRDHNNDVDVVIAKRSTGSILKPFLYASALTHGILLPKMLMPDVPTYVSGYAPKNYFPTFDGAVSADQALYRSLNVPFVRLLQQYGVDRFYHDLQNLEMSTLHYPSSHYGLSLILGGAETKLIDLAHMYAGMARVLNHQDVAPLSKSFTGVDIVPTGYKAAQKNARYLSPGAIYHTFEAMTQVSRPVSEDGWQSFTSSRRVAWKTGTSFGNKDAWAVGTTPEYVVAVWVGNADGEGRPGLTGVTSAAPLMFDLFSLLGPTTWFYPPYDDMTQASVCSKSGYRSSKWCEGADTVWLPQAVNKTLACPFHRVVHLSPDERWRVNAYCERPSKIKHKKWFMLPPIQEWYYKRKAPLYKTLPPLREDCFDPNAMSTMEFIYPKNSNKLYIPVQLDGSKGRVVFEVAHRNPQKQLFWHLNGVYLGTTREFHQMEIYEGQGKHKLVVVDEDGVELIKQFYILND